MPQPEVSSPPQPPLELLELLLLDFEPLSHLQQSGQPQASAKISKSRR